MSKENLYKFIQLLYDNKEALSETKELGGDVEAIVRHGQKLGYDFDQNDVKEYQSKALNLLKSNVEKKLKSETPPDEKPGVGQIKQLIALGETDETVGRRLTELGMGNSQDLIAYGQEKGFIFDEADMEIFAKDIMEPADELSDEELETAAGGAVLLTAFLLAAAFVAVGGAVIGAVGAVSGAVAVLSTKNRG